MNTYIQPEEVTNLEAQYGGDWKVMFAGDQPGLEIGDTYEVILFWYAKHTFPYPDGEDTATCAAENRANLAHLLRAEADRLDAMKG